MTDRKYQGSTTSRICSRCHMEKPLRDFAGKTSVRVGDLKEFKTCESCRTQLRNLQRSIRADALAYQREKAKPKPRFVK